MSAPRPHSDPIEQKRRQLAEQERLLTVQMSRLRDELEEAGQPPEPEIKPVEHPVWRMEDESVSRRVAEPTPARKRSLARQQQRDMILFFVLITVFVVMLGLVVWLAWVRTHNGMSGT